MDYFLTRCPACTRAWIGITGQYGQVWPRQDVKTDWFNQAAPAPLGWPPNGEITRFASSNRLIAFIIWFFVNCSGLTYNHMRERTLVLSFLMFKVISIFVLKLSKFLNPKACRLMSLMSLLVASSLMSYFVAFYYKSYGTFFILKKVL